MLIVFIITAVLLFISYLLMNILYKGSDKRSMYEFYTKPRKESVLSTHLLFWIGSLIIALIAIKCFLSDKETALGILYGLFIIFAILSLLMFYAIFFNYIAIKGENLHIHRFFATKIVPINKIEIIKVSQAVVEFFDKDNFMLLTINAMTPDFDVFIALINEKKAGEIVNLDLFVNDADEKEAYTDESAHDKMLPAIGSRYREQYPTTRKRIIQGISITLIISIFAISGLLLLAEQSYIFVLIVDLLLVAASLLILKAKLAKMDKELDNDDTWLGNKHKEESGIPKYTNRKKFKNTINLCISLIILGLLCSYLSINMLQRVPIEADEFLPLNGELEYYRRMPGRDEYIAIGLKGQLAEYRLTSAYVDEFDKSFFDEVKEGDKITIYVDIRQGVHEFKSDKTDKTKWTNFYMLATDEKEYFSYNDYLKSFSNMRPLATTILIVAIVMVVGSVIILFVSYKRHKKFE